MKRETYTLSKQTAIELIKKTVKRRKYFSFQDIEKVQGKELTTEDKFLIRSIAVKNFHMNIVYISPFNQLRFYRTKGRR